MYFQEEKWIRYLDDQNILIFLYVQINFRRIWKIENILRRFPEKGQNMFFEIFLIQTQNRWKLMTKMGQQGRFWKSDPRMALEPFQSLQQEHYTKTWANPENITDGQWTTSTHNPLLYRLKSDVLTYQYQ